MFNKKDVNMLEGPIVKGLLTIAIPVMIMNIVQSLFNIVDMTILKAYDTDNAVGAVGVCGYLTSLMTGLVIGVASGSNVVVAKHIGKKDEESAQKAVGTSLVFSVLGGLLLLVIGVSCANLFLTWMNCAPTLLPSAALYFRLYFLGIPILMVYNFSAALLRSTGDTKRPMIYLTLGGVIKIGCTFLFVAVFKWQVVGVALATIISWAISAFLAVRALVKNEGVVKIKKEHLRIYKEELKEMLYLGIPAGMQQALYSIANVVISATVNTFGESATIGISIANQFDGILYQISTAPALAVMPYVSQNIGAGNIDRAKKAVSRGMMITILLGVSFGMLSAILSAQLSSIMSDNPEVIAYSQQKMWLISPTYFLSGINEILGAAMRGMRKPIVATVCTLIFMCAIRFVWVYLIFPLFPVDHALTYLYLIWPIGWILSIITLLCFYFPTVKQLRKNQLMHATINTEGQEETDEQVFDNEETFEYEQELETDSQTDN